MAQLRKKPFRRTLACGLLALSILCLSPARVVALPIADYHENLNKAITALDTLLQRDEEESATDYQNRFADTLAGVRTLLPPRESVEVDGEVCNVDNSWLHKALDELNQSSDLVGKLRQIVETLHAIEQRVAEREEYGAPLETKDQAKSRLESIVARPEYATGARGPNALSRLIQDFVRWLQKLFPKRASMEPGRASWISFIAQIVVIVSALLLLVYVVRIALTRFKRSGKFRSRKKREPRIVLGERLEPEETSSDLLSEAEALARRGDLRAAIRKAYIALLVELGDRKLISLAQHKTNRDYVNSLRNVPDLHLMMGALTDSFERHWYGFAQATQDDWRDFRAGYVAALQTGN